MERLVIGCWVTMSALVLGGGVTTWAQLKFQASDPISKYLARLRLVCAMMAIILLRNTGMVRRSWQAEPVFTLYALLTVTLMAGALWGWFFLTIGLVNGDGWYGVAKRLFDPKRRRSMIEDKQDDESSVPDKPANAG